MMQPFFAKASEQILDDLKSRIKNARWPDEIKKSEWDYGTNLSYMRELADYWLNKFDWRKIEAGINSLNNFIAEINGHKIHFIHVPGKGKKSIPLIITHGWPGSFLEMIKLVPLLTSNQDVSFDLVIPSVIGFGYSGRCTTPGCNSSFVADLWHKLMSELGYKKYGTQGGDIGAGISTWLSLKYPDSIIGLHLNYIPGSYKPFLKTGEQLSEDVITFQKSLNEWIFREGAYANLHRSKPLTLAYGLNDSPVGLCGWMIEKFHAWSDNKGNIENVFTKDELLGNVTLYWVTQTIHSSIRIYSENNRRHLIFGENDFVKVPVAFANFPKELPTPPRSYIEKGFNIQRWTEMPAGGHFAAMEQPKLFAKDVIDFFTAL